MAIVCAVRIDFGTARTGYGFAFKHNQGEAIFGCNIFLPASNVLIKPTTAKIHTKEPGGQGAGKTNTVLLLNKDQEFKAFGSKALDAYFEDNCEGQDLLFEKFKMNLHCQDENITMQAKALNGKLTK